MKFVSSETTRMTRSPFDRDKELIEVVIPTSQPKRLQLQKSGTNMEQFRQIKIGKGLVPFLNHSKNCQP